ncbi:MAG: hypothetical protein Fur0041_00730 [Bacteroidia bacterium]
MNIRLKSIFILLVAALFVAGDAQAETLKKRRKKKKKGKVVAFKQGQIGGQVAAGFVVKSNYKKTDYSIYGENTYDKGFPWGFRFEYGVADFLGIGVMYGMYSEKVNINDVTVSVLENKYGYDQKMTLLCVRPAFHVPLGMAKLDPYVALPFGLNKVKVTPFGDYNYVQEPLKSGFAWGIHAGANFYFSKNIGAFVEGGYGQWVPLINVGLAVKI